MSQVDIDHQFMQQAIEQAGAQCRSGKRWERKHRDARRARSAQQ